MRHPFYLRIWLYLAKRSDRQGAPVLIWKEKKVTLLTVSALGKGRVPWQRENSFLGRISDPGRRAQGASRTPPPPGSVFRKLLSESRDKDWLSFQGALYLPGAEPHHQVGNEGVFSLPGAVGHHDAPSIGLGQLAPRSQKQPPA